MYLFWITLSKWRFISFKEVGFFYGSLVSGKTQITRPKTINSLHVQNIQILQLGKKSYYTNCEKKNSHKATHVQCNLAFKLNFTCFITTENMFRISYLSLVRMLVRRGLLMWEEAGVPGKNLFPLRNKHYRTGWSNSARS